MTEQAKESDNLETKRKESKRSRKVLVVWKGGQLLEVYISFSLLRRQSEQREKHTFPEWWPVLFYPDIDKIMTTIMKCW